MEQPPSLKLLTAVSEEKERSLETVTPTQLIRDICHFCSQPLVSADHMISVTHGKPESSILLCVQDAQKFLMSNIHVYHTSLR